MKTTRTPLFLMANLGSEMSQLFLYLEKGELKMAESASSRANRIIQELLAAPDLQGRTKEVEIIQEIIQDALSKKHRFQVKKVDIEEYFMPFALRALSV